MFFLTSFSQSAGMPLSVLAVVFSILVAILVVIVIIGGLRYMELKKKYEAFMHGKNGQSLENVLLERLKQIDHIVATQEEMEARIGEVTGHYENTFQKIGLVKYDAFEEMAGKMSFSLALLNRNNNGFVLNAMHSREGCFTYIKEVIDGHTVILLTDEEKEALDEALKSG